MMMSVMRLSPVAAVLIVLVLPLSVFAQEPARTRQGFWFNGGIGWGSSDCDACDSGRTGGAAGVLAVGGTISQKLMLGASANGWRKDQDNVALTLGSLTAMVRFYPARAGNFYLLGGLGISNRKVETDTSVGTVSLSENGTAAIIGAGYDIRIGTNVSLTPFANAVGVDFDGEGSGFTQVGLSITVH